jgi:hypothetical protein
MREFDTTPKSMMGAGNGFMIVSPHLDDDHED